MQQKQAKTGRLLMAMLCFLACREHAPMFTPPVEGPGWQSATMWSGGWNYTRRVGRARLTINDAGLDSSRTLDVDMRGTFAFPTPSIGMASSGLLIDELLIDCRVVANMDETGRAMGAVITCRSRSLSNLAAPEEVLFERILVFVLVNRPGDYF